MNHTFEIYDIDSGIEYIKAVAPQIFDNLRYELNAINATESEYMVKYKMQKLVHKTIPEAFEISGKDVVLLKRRDNGIIDVRKYFTHSKELHINGKYDHIEDKCLFHSPNLETLIFDEGVKYIGSSTFYNKPTLKKVVFSNTVNIISLDAFADCSELEDVVFTNPTTNINPSAFYGTKWLENFTDEFIVVNGQLLKYNGNDEKIIIPEGVCKINYCVFENNEKIKSVVCPSTLKVIGVASFYGCINLENVALNDGLETIDGLAFAECKKLKELILPESIEHFCNEAVHSTKVIFHNVNPILTEHITKWFNYEIME